MISRGTHEFAVCRAPRVDNGEREEDERRDECKICGHQRRPCVCDGWCDTPLSPASYSEVAAGITSSRSAGHPADEVGEQADRDTWKAANRISNVFVVTRKSYSMMS